jgi:hypothetical protein
MEVIMGKVGPAIAVVFVEVGKPKADALCHLSSECESIPAEGVRPVRWADAKSILVIPVFCEACGPFSKL